MTTTAALTHGKKKATDEVVKKKGWKKVCLIGAPFAAVVFGLYSFSYSPYLQVKEIRWTGAQRIDARDLDRQFQSVLGQNMLRLSISDIHAALITNRWVKEAVIRKVFPNRIDVALTERVPAAVEIDPASQRMLIRDSEGVILEEGKEENLPHVIYYNPSVYTKAMELAPLLAKRKDALIDLSKPDNLSVRLDKGVLHLGDRDFKKRWERFTKVEDDLDRRKVAPWEADLRFPSQIVVKTKTAAIAVVDEE